MIVKRREDFGTTENNKKKNTHLEVIDLYNKEVVEKHLPRRTYGNKLNDVGIFFAKLFWWALPILVLLGLFLLIKWWSLIIIPLILLFEIILRNV